MGKPKAKGKGELYAEAVIKLAEKKEAYDKMKNKETKTAAKNLTDSADLTTLINELKPFKDSWTLSTTAKTFIKDQAKELFYGYHKGLDNKYLEKGHKNEDEAIELLNQVTGKSYVKNEERKTLTWLTGEWDIDDAEDELIIDIKNAWDLSTFPAFKEDVNKKVKEAGYDWQQKGYCILKKYKKAKICYTITETPAELIPDWEDVTLHQVNHIAPSKRVSFSDLIELTDQDVKDIKSAYKAANVYYKECLTELRAK